MFKYCKFTRLPIDSGRVPAQPWARDQGSVCERRWRVAVSRASNLVICKINSEHRGPSGILGREPHDPIERGTVQLVTPVRFRVHREFERREAGRARLEQLAERITRGRCVRHAAPLAQHAPGIVKPAALLQDLSDWQQRATLLVLRVLCGLRACTPQG